jgi:hypothetical protein
MYSIGIMFSKLSILFIFMKVFVPFHEGLIYWMNQLLIYINVLFYMGAVVALLLQCIPRAKIANPTLPGRCTDVYLFAVISGAWNVASDFVILAFSVWAIRHLNMPLTRKFGIGILFGTGALYVHLFIPFIASDKLTIVFLTSALLCSIMRLHATSQITHNPDLGFIFCKVGLWTYFSPLILHLQIQG